MGYRAFVSSTFRDLRRHRAHVIKVLQKSGFTTDPMENWTAATEEPKEFSQDRVAGCDLMILLVGFRRGHIPKGETLSITQLEYRYACKNDIDVLVFLLDEATDWDPQWNSMQTDPELRRWRGELAEQKGVETFGRTTASLKISPALTRWIEERTSKASLPGTGNQRGRRWLAEQATRLESAFAQQLSGYGPGEADPFERYVDFLVNELGVPGATSSDRPIASLAATPGRRYLLIGAGGSGKSIGLLKLAADAASRARDDRHSPLPLYAKLNLFDATENGLQRLLQLMAQKAAADPDDLANLWREGRRPFLFLLDGFNEVAREFQPACLKAIQELLAVALHGAIVSSRPDAPFEPLQADGMRMVQIVEFDDERIREFLERHGAAELNGRLLGSLRQLGRNPFMLWALAQSCADMPPGRLPRNQGELYSNFIERYIFEIREERKVPPPTRYHYRLVKKPLLSDLALSMTRQGVTRCPEDLPHLKEIGTRLQRLKSEYQGLIELKDHESMPDPPIAKSLVDEVVQNGVVRRNAGSLEFMHHSVQEWFAAVALSDVPLAEILPEVPTAKWVPGEIRPSNVCQAPLGGALVMLAGLLPNNTELVGNLLSKDITLAAACFAAGEDDQETRRKLVTACLTLLTSSDPTQQFIGCKAAYAARLQENDIVDAVSRLTLSESQAVAVEALTCFLSFETGRAIPVLLEVLAKTRYVSARLAAAALVGQTAGRQDRMLTVSLGVLQDEDSDSPYPEQGTLRPSRVLREAFELFQANASVDDLIRSALQGENPDPAVILLRLLYADEAREKITGIARSDDDPFRLSAIAKLPEISGSETVIEALMAFLDEPWGDPDLAGRAGIALASTAVQRLVLPPQFIQTLRERMTGDGLGPAVRAGYAVALFHAGNEEDRRTISARVLNPSEPVTYRVTFCSHASHPLCPSWMFPMDPGEYGRRQKLLEMFLDLVKSEADPDVREAAALGSSRFPEGKQRLLSILTDAAQIPRARAAAAIALGRAGYEPVVAVVSEMVSQDDLEKNLMMSVYMSSLFFIEEEEERRCIAPMVIEMTGDLRGVASEDGNDRLIMHAMEAVHNWAPRETIAGLRRLLLEPASPEQVREGAALALGLLNVEEAKSVLTEVSGDSSDQAAAAAAHFGLQIASYMRTNAHLPAAGERLLLRGIAYAIAGNWQHALADCDQVIAAFTESAATRRLRSLCLAALDRLPEALEEGLAAAKLSPGDAQNHTNLGKIYTSLGRSADALASYRESVRLDPQNCPAAYFDLGLALVGSGESSEAGVQYASGIESCRRLPAGEAQEVIEGAIRALDELAQKRPELSTPIAGLRLKVHRAQSGGG